MLNFLIKKGLDVGLKAVGIGTEDELDKALKKGLTPEQLAAWKTAQHESQRLDNDDRIAAREMNMNNRDKIVPALALFAALLVVPILGGLFYVDIPQDNKETLIMIIGTILGWSGSVFTFYFGSTYQK